MARNFTNRNVCKNFAKTVDVSNFVELNGNTGTSKGAGGEGVECSQVTITHFITDGVFTVSYTHLTLPTKRIV